MLAATKAYGLTFLFPENDQAIGQSLRDYGEFARPEVELIAHYLKATPGTFIDVGANIGSICLPVAAAFRQRRVIAYEAHRGLCQVLSANALINRLINVEANHAGVGAAPGLARFPNAPLNSIGNFGTLGFHLADQGPTAPVRVAMLDEEAPPDTSFVKIDVEGFEPEVLRGASRTIRDLRPIWLVEFNNQPSSRIALRVFLEAGYSVYWFAAPFVTPAHKKPNPQPPGIRGDMNFLALPAHVSNTWGLKPILTAGEAPPQFMNEHPYLARYGFEV